MWNSTDNAMAPAPADQDKPDVIAILRFIRITLHGRGLVTAVFTAKFLWKDFLKFWRRRVQLCISADREITPAKLVGFRRHRDAAAPDRTRPDPSMFRRTGRVRLEATPELQ
ncbi:hypothetical protein Q0601_18240 [Paracoccus onubensis]|uniref:hypothetical protein n=1 Tax=Paracoccus onubensis TaxID=1675788 RepID=UPI00272F2F55|nr:hypothetical protein [Paracoccus onubensis]MDP0929129.1 hypothetical protein [Paracoccus onubensis]